METILSSWQDGLDSRRSNLTTSPHALERAENVHINQGAEIEKRRAFVDFGVQAATAFGLEVTSAGLVTFGSAATPALPLQVSYVRIQHPSDVTQVMTAVLCSCSFGGKSWTVARFANGDTFIYYNGTVIPACINGLVLTSAATNLAIATQLYTFLNTTYFTSLGIKASAPVLNGTSYYVDIYSTPGVSFALTSTIVLSATGTIGTLLISNQSQGTAFSQANFAFAVYMGQTGSLTQVLVSTDAGLTYGVSLLGAPIVWAPLDTNGFSTALNIAATISSSVTALPITAKANNNQVTLLADSSLGATPNGYLVKLVSTGDFCLDDMVLDFSAVTTFSSTSLLVGSLATVFAGQTYNGGGTYVQATPAGTYFWHKGLNDISMSVAAGPTYFADNFFTIAVVTNITFTGIASNPVTAILTKMVEILGSVTAGTTASTLVAAMATKIRAYTTANSLKYTACQSQANTKQLVVSRNEITSALQFYPVLATDVVGVGGIFGTVVQTSPLLQGLYIPFVTSIGVQAPAIVISGVVNISITGGAAPYLVTSSVTANSPFTFTLPDGNPSAVSGSFIGSLNCPSGNITAVSTNTAQYTIKVTDAIGNVKSLIMTVQATVDGSAILRGFSVTFL